MSINTNTGQGFEPIGLRTALRSFLRHREQYLSVISGVFTHWRTQKTPDAAYQSMISLFCATQGESNDLISRFFSWLHTPYRILQPKGVLNIEDGAKRTKAIETLRDTGLYVFPDRLPESVCDELMKIALTETCVINDPSGQKTRGPYNRQSPHAVKYSIPAEALINQPVIQKLISDMSIIWLAQEYLESKPILDHLVMWWITNINDAPDTEAAQLYHFDMDKVKFLKFFFYVTDVGPENGPHTFIQKSHKRGGIPASLLERGYARINDEEVAPFYPAEDIIEITGRRGTIFAEDTRGLHKGTKLVHGDRLVFELEFSNSLFGGSRLGPSFSKVQTPELSTALSQYPRVYSYFDTRSA
jgi:hypothetical protein